MKVHVDSFAWFNKSDLTAVQLQALRREMTIIPDKSSEYADDDEVKPIYMYLETEERFGIAREYFLQRRRPDHDVTFAVTKGSEDWHPATLNPEIRLRIEQRQGLDLVKAKFDAGHHGGLLRAVPGWGKTVAGVALMAELEVPTLVVVHKEFLMNQWLERITGTGDNPMPALMPDAKVGICQQDECDFRGKTVVLAMVHSLASRRYHDDFYEWPGLIVVDESLRYEAQVLTREGYRAIGELVESSNESVEVMAYDTQAKRFEWRPVTKRWVHKPRSQMLRIRHDRGVLECTANHEVLTSFGYVRAARLVPGSDFLVCWEGVGPRPVAEGAESADCGLDNGGWEFVPDAQGDAGSVPGSSFGQAGELVDAKYEVLRGIVKTRPHTKKRVCSDLCRRARAIYRAQVSHYGKPKETLPEILDRLK